MLKLETFIQSKILGCTVTITTDFVLFLLIKWNKSVSFYILFLSDANLTKFSVSLFFYKQLHYIPLILYQFVLTRVYVSYSIITPEVILEDPRTLKTTWYVYFSASVVFSTIRTVDCLTLKYLHTDEAESTKSVLDLE